MMGGGMGLLQFGGFGMLLFWGVVIVVLVLIVRTLLNEGRRSYSDSPPPEQQTPIEILQARYAKGEISAEEYDRTRRALESA